MSDTAIQWDVQNACGDWVLLGSQLQTGNDLQTAVLISLFTDRTATADDIIPDSSGDPRGWVGDLDETYPIGSRLWLLDRSKQTATVLASATDYCAEALQWLIDDGVVARFSIVVEWTRPAMMGIQIVAYQSSGTQSAMNFAAAWNPSPAETVPPQRPLARLDVDFTLGSSVLY